MDNAKNKWAEWLATSDLRSFNIITFTPVMGYAGSKAEFTIPDDIAEVVNVFDDSIEDGKCGGPGQDWTAIAKLKDGRCIRFWYWLNGCGSQYDEGGEIADSWEQLVTMALTEGERGQL